MAIIRPKEARQAPLTDERLHVYLTLGSFWTAGLGALLLSNIDPLAEHETPAQIVTYLDNPLSEIHLRRIINGDLDALRRIVSLWQENPQNSRWKVSSEDFLSWAKAQNVPGIKAFLNRAGLTRPERESIFQDRRHKIMDYPFRGEMSSAIVTAISKARDPESYHSVWEELLKLAEQQFDIFIGVTATGKIRFRNRKGETDLYEKSSLEKSLGRAVKAAKPPTRPHKAP